MARRSGSKATTSNLGKSAGKGRKHGSAAGRGGTDGGDARSSAKTKAPHSGRGKSSAAAGVHKPGRGTTGRGKVKAAAGEGGSPGPPEPTKQIAPKCRYGHVLAKRSDNPKIYKNQACCDVCGLQKLPQRCEFFFHCSFCRWDICPTCGKKRLDGKRKRGRGGDDDGTPKSELRARETKEQEEPQYTRARRDIWLPTEETAVNREPLAAPPAVLEWREGVPV
mmetsp:Transcript_95073/g.268654  ORF Transcript_95073/g.268654 Transcript_95073/m.268654 type:complete len:222 (+) Transcript_95073:165-830(+)